LIKGADDDLLVDLVKAAVRVTNEINGARSLELNAKRWRTFRRLPFSFRPMGTSRRASSKMEIVSDCLSEDPQERPNQVICIFARRQIRQV